MLQSIRDRSQGLIVGVIVFLISLTFALWGIQSYIDADSEVVVAEAGGEEIHLREFQESLQQFRQQAQSVLGEQFDPNAWDSDEVRNRALDELVNERLILETIDDSRIRISNEQVARQLQQIPSFQDENGFSRQLYEQRVPLLGLSQTGFEQKLRQDMAQAQLRAGIAASEFVTASEAKHIERLRKQKRDIGYAIIPGSNFDDQIEVSDADINAYFSEHQEDYRTDELLILDYLQISVDALKADVVVTPAALKAEYEANQAVYTVAEERNVNHILIQVAESATPEEEASAAIKVAEALSRAKSGEAFETLAKELSDDVGSSAEGGETGFFPKGVMAPEFEESAFALSVDQISEPIRTKFGFHILKLKAIKAGGLKSFDDARDDVEAAYREAEAQKLFFDQATEFSNLVYENPDSLAVAAEVLGLEIKQTPSLSRTGLADLFSEKVATTAFETEVLLERLNAEPIELPDGRVVAIRVAEHTQSRIPAVADVRHQVEAALREQQQRSRAKDAGDTLIEQIRAGGDAAALAKAQGLGWESANGVGRDSDKVNRAVLRAAFKEPVDAEKRMGYVGVPIGRSDYAVITVGNVTMPSEDSIASSDITAVRSELVPARATGIWQEFVSALRANSDVKIYRENL